MAQPQGIPDPLLTDYAVQNAQRASDMADKLAALQIANAEDVPHLLQVTANIVRNATGGIQRLTTAIGSKHRDRDRQPYITARNESLTAVADLADAFLPALKQSIAQHPKLVADIAESLCVFLPTIDSAKKTDSFDPDRLTLLHKSLRALEADALLSIDFCKSHDDGESWLRAVKRVIADAKPATQETLFARAKAIGSPVSIVGSLQWDLEMLHRRLPKSETAPA